MNLLKVWNFDPWTMVFQTVNMVLFTGAVFSSIYVWFNAKKKGMDHWFWSIISLILFPVGFTGYLLYRYLKINSRER